MNGRTHAEDTPEGRLAAVARSLDDQMMKKFNRHPDFADFRQVFKPFVEKELILARIAEARKLGSKQLTQRMQELTRELHAAEKALPNEFNLLP
jgi:hypothetical protein